MSELIPWNEFNPNAVYFWEGMSWENTNIACPECGKPLVRRTDIVLCTYPPQRQYKCTNCGWRGSK